MRLTRLIALLTAAALCAAAPAACSKKPNTPPGKLIVVKWRISPAGVTKSSPKKEFRCVAYHVLVANHGYDRVEFDPASFSLEVEGNQYPAADAISCATAEAAGPAKLMSGQSWKAVVAFEQPTFTTEPRVLLKPVKVKDSLFGYVSSPVIDYQIWSGN